MKWVAIGLGFIIIVLGALYFFTNSSPRIIPITINSATLNVWVADTDNLRSRGLSGKSSMPSNYGMLFLFPEANNYRFWMKDMNFPLDFVWIRDKKIVDMTLNVEHPKRKSDPLPYYSAKETVNAVLELNAGSVKTYGLHVGDSVRY